MITRGSGILMHLTSLPSRFGIGDMGPEVYERLGESLIVQSHREVRLKGIEDPMILHEVDGIKAS